MGKTPNNKHNNDQETDYLQKTEELVDSYNRGDLTEEERLEYFERLLRDYFEIGKEDIVEAIIKLIWIGKSDKTSDKITDVLSERKQLSKKELSTLKRLMTSIRLNCSNWGNF